MTFETLAIATDARGIATLSLNIPDKHNVLSPIMIAELTEVARLIGDDSKIRAVILTGAGKSFCAGGDLGWMKTQFTATRQQRMAEAGKLAAMLKGLNELPKPLIGRIQGQAYGGGMGMVSVCDVAIAVDTAKFGFTETRLGLIPATISPYVVARMGEGRARRVFMSARLFGADEARDLGLVARVVSAGQLDQAIEAEVAPYLATSPQAVAASKALARSLGPAIDPATIEATIARLADAWETNDAHEGVAAFFDKRKPAFSA